MAYEVSDNVREALNKYGLWHGRAELLIPVHEWEELYQSNPMLERWNNPYWEAFGGLYVAGSKYVATTFARDMTDRLNFWYEDPDDWPPGLQVEWPIAEAIVHRVYLLEGAKVALDEDEFGWGTMTADFVAGRSAPWEALTPPASVVREQSELYRDIKAEIEQENKELWDQHNNVPSLMGELYDPLEEQDFISELTIKWAGPVLEHWAHTSEWPSPFVPDPPNIRILNEYWKSEPPFGQIAM